VLAVGKEELLKEDLPCGEERGDFAFRVLSRGPEGIERIERFDGVLDCTGVWATPRWLGHGGIPAVGELALADQIEHRLPDILGRDRAQYAGRHTLLVGAGMAAATNLVVLVALADQVPGTRITWVTRREGPAGGGPIPVRPDDPWPQRAALARQANELARQAACVEHLPLAMVEEVRKIAPEGPLEVVLSGPAGRTLRVDRIVANVGFRPDETLATELQVAPSPCGWALRLWPGGAAGLAGSGRDVAGGGRGTRGVGEERRLPRARGVRDAVARAARSGGDQRACLALLGRGAGDALLRPGGQVGGALRRLYAARGVRADSPRLRTHRRPGRPGPVRGRAATGAVRRGYLTCGLGDWLTDRLSHQPPARLPAW